MGGNQSSSSSDDVGKARLLLSTVELPYYEKLFEQLSIDKGKIEHAGFLTWSSFEVQLDPKI